VVYRRLKKTRKIQSAHAILIVSERYAMQLRDNKPNISSPGIWSLFGGLIRKGEKPMHAIEREIDEELCIKPERFQPFRFIDYY
jgi:8-oxo-dGTP pyrophosphatase MutT (NUDIX family)